jgi:hypothetical protein
VRPTERGRPTTRRSVDAIGLDPKHRDEEQQGAERSSRTSTLRLDSAGVIHERLEPSPTALHHGIALDGRAIVVRTESEDWDVIVTIHRPDKV